MRKTTKKKGIILLGLGPGGVEQMTRQAWDWIGQCKEIYLRTKQHPSVKELPSSLKIFSFDNLYEQADNFEAVYQNIINKILELGQRDEGVTYAVPGHPFIAEATAPAIYKEAIRKNIPIRVINGISFIDPVFAALGMDPFPMTTLVDALELVSHQMPLFPPSEGALIAQIYNRQVASEVKMTLMTVYPDHHPVTLVHAAGNPEELVESLPLFDLDRSEHIGLLTVVYLPPLDKHSSLESFQEVVARLRAPDGCPWDREQTHGSLRKYLLEETYETLEAIDNEDTDSMVEEMGDLLLQIVLNAQIATEDGEFTMADVIRGINEKIIRRHPHVFGDVKVAGVDGVLQNWQKLKEIEHAEKGEDEPKGMLDGVPRGLPALSQAQEYQSRVARVGFDWEEIQPVWDKVMEELEEMRQAKTEVERAEELGDLLFALVNLIRWYKTDAESALRLANEKFKKRFGYIENKARLTNRKLTEMTLQEMDLWWDEAKAIENRQSSG